jgi:hypothetical protein
LIARGNGIRTLDRLVRDYGPGKWRKLKGIAQVRDKERIRRAEIHWYEANGIGQRDFKVKRFLD